MAKQVADKGVTRMPSRRRETRVAGRVQSLGGEVAADEAPVGAVGRVADAAGARVEEPRGLGERRAVGEGGAALDEDAVRQLDVSDEDPRRAQEADGDDWAVARVEAPEKRAQPKGRPAPER